MNCLSAVRAIGFMAAVLLLALTLSMPPSAAGPGLGRTLPLFSTPVSADSSAPARTPAPLRLAAIPATPGPAAVQARYCTDLIRNGSFESGNFMYWSTSGAPVVLSTGGHTGSHSAQLGGRDNALDRLSQTVSCPFSGDRVEGALYLYIHTAQPASAGADCLKTAVLNNDGGGGGFWTYPKDLAADTWHHLPFSIESLPYACEPGVTWQFDLEATTDAANPAWFLVDDVSLALCCFDDPHEPNNDFAAASAVSPGSHDLRLCPSGDEDWFRFDAVAGQHIFLRLQIVEAGQATVCLVSPAGEEVGCDWDVYPYTATLARTATMSGSWRARVHDPGYQTFGKPLRLGIEVYDAPPTATPTATPTAPGVTPRVYLPVVLKDVLQPGPTCGELVSNGGFESGLSPWGSSGAAGRGPGRTGVWGGWLGGQDNAYGELIQWIYLPAGANPAPWEFWWRAEAGSQQPGDVLRAFIQAPGDEPVLLTLPATGALNTWQHAAVDLSPYAGKGFFLSFGATTDASTPTTFRIDDVSAKGCVRP